MKLKYKSLQIIKHALAYYMTRPNASEKDLEVEGNLLQKITELVDGLKDKYKID